MLAKLAKALGFTMAAAVAAVALVFALTHDFSAHADKPWVPMPEDLRVQKEMMPQNSNEFLRFHFRNANGVEVQTLIKFRDGSKAHLKNRENGTLQFTQKQDKSGFVISEQTFAEDGRTPIGGFQRRADHTLQTRIEQDKSGAITTYTYWWDGVSLFQKLTTQSDRSYVLEDFHRNGQPWLKQKGPKADTASDSWEYANGKLLRYREESYAKGIIITGYRPDGTAQYQQQFPRPDYWWAEKKLTVVLEYAPDGITVARKIQMTIGGYYYPGHVEIPNADGSTLVHELRSDGSIAHEETRKANGEVVDKKEYTTSDHMETIDKSWLQLPPIADPLEVFNKTERDVNFRNLEP